MNKHAFLVLTNIPASDGKGEFTSRPQVIGPGQDADLTVPASFSSVSRRHAEVRIEAGQPTIRDL